MVQSLPSRQTHVPLRMLCDIEQCTVRFRSRLFKSRHDRRMLFRSVLFYSVTVRLKSLRVLFTSISGVSFQKAKTEIAFRRSEVSIKLCHSIFCMESQSIASKSFQSASQELFSFDPFRVTRSANRSRSPCI